MMITTLVVFGVAILLIGLLFGAALGGIAVEAAARSSREQQEEEIIRLRNELGRIRSARRLEAMRDEAMRGMRGQLMEEVRGLFAASEQASAPDPDALVVVGSEPVGSAA